MYGHAGEPVPGSGLRFPTRAASPSAVPGYGASDQYQQQWNQRVWSGEPIIQDGWQWDPYAQQWIPPRSPARPRRRPRHDRRHGAGRPAAPVEPRRAPRVTPRPAEPAAPRPPTPPPIDEPGPEDGTQIRPPQP